jgi:quercetin dioxygenase-like cupin family protein
MTLHRIRAASLGGTEALRSRLAAEGIQLSAGRTMLNRHAAGASALIVVRGVLNVGVLDDDAVLGPGDGVLLPDGTTYSLQAPDDVVAVLFALPDVNADGEGPDSGARDP